jgi:transposase
MWIPPEAVDPIVLNAPGRKSVGEYGAVRVSNGQLVPQQSEVLNAESFQMFLKRLFRHRRTGRQMVIILDNARYHHAVFLQPWLNSHQEVLQLDFLPPYSPELNPIERVWKLTRTLCTHNRYFPTLESLVNAVSQRFEIWSKPNEQLAQLCAIN